MGGASTLPENLEHTWQVANLGLELYLTGIGDIAQERENRTEKYTY